ncbi:MAG: hypothetical protein QGH60_01950 [Phycisphaerae bacterium]|jgi:hypothetical protein|nr:hypothetical protein [Phycisphaerae bacterium]
MMNEKATRDRLRAICPEIRPILDELDVRELGLCSQLVALADFAVGLFDAEVAQHVRLEAIFGFVERLMGDGTPDVRNAAATGFLESLQRTVCRGEIDGEVFFALMHTESRRFCREMDDFWGAETPGLE